MENLQHSQCQDSMEAKYSLSQRNAKILIDPDNFRYNFSSKQSNKSNWACVERRKDARCPATAVVDSESDTIISNNHTHTATTC